MSVAALRLQLVDERDLQVTQMAVWILLAPCSPLLVRRFPFSFLRNPNDRQATRARCWPRF